MRLRPTRCFAALIGMVSLDGCFTYRLPYGPNSEALSPVSDEQVRITDVRGVRYDLYHAHIDRDSVIGQHPDSTLRRFAVPLADVSTLEIRRPNTDANAMLLSVGALAALVLIVGHAVHVDWLP